MHSDLFWKERKKDEKISPHAKIKEKTSDLNRSDLCNREMKCVGGKLDHLDKLDHFGRLDYLGKLDHLDRLDHLGRLKHLYRLNHLGKLNHLG